MITREQLLLKALHIALNEDQEKINLVIKEAENFFKKQESLPEGFLKGLTGLQESMESAKEKQFP